MNRSLLRVAETRTTPSRSSDVSLLRVAYSKQVGASRRLRRSRFRCADDATARPMRRCRRRQSLAKGPPAVISAATQLLTDPRSYGSAHGLARLPCSPWLAAAEIAATGPALRLGDLRSGWPRRTLRARKPQSEGDAAVGRGRRSRKGTPQSEGDAGDAAEGAPGGFRLRLPLPTALLARSPWLFSCRVILGCSAEIAATGPSDCAPGALGARLVEAAGP